MKLYNPFDAPTDVKSRVGRHVFANTDIATSVPVAARIRMWDDLLQARRERRQHSAACLGTSSGGDAA